MWPYTFSFVSIQQESTDSPSVPQSSLASRKTDRNYIKLTGHRDGEQQHLKSEPFPWRRNSKWRRRKQPLCRCFRNKIPCTRTSRDLRLQIWELFRSNNDIVQSFHRGLDVLRDHHGHRQNGLERGLRGWSQGLRREENLRFRLWRLINSRVDWS